jgi:hypothetical protein
MMDFDDDVRPSSVNDIMLDEVNDVELKKLSEYFEKSSAEIQKVKYIGLDTMILGV